MSSLVKITTCDNSFQAQLFKTKLESEGIPAMVADENMGTIYGNAVTAFNPHILVREEDAERARAILKECGDL